MKLTRISNLLKQENSDNNDSSSNIKTYLDRVSDINVNMTDPNTILSVANTIGFFDINHNLVSSKLQLDLSDNYTLPTPVTHWDNEILSCIDMEIQRLENKLARLGGGNGVNVIGGEKGGNVIGGGHVRGVNGNVRGVGVSGDGISKGDVSYETYGISKGDVSHETDSISNGDVSRETYGLGSVDDVSRETNSKGDVSHETNSISNVSCETNNKISSSQFAFSESTGDTGSLEKDFREEGVENGTNTNNTNTSFIFSESEDNSLDKDGDFVASKNKNKENNKNKNDSFSNKDLESNNDYDLISRETKGKLISEINNTLLSQITQTNLISNEIRLIQKKVILKFIANNQKSLNLNSLKITIKSYISLINTLLSSDWVNITPNEYNKGLIKQLIYNSLVTLREINGEYQLKIVQF